MLTRMDEIKITMMKADGSNLLLQPNATVHSRMRKKIAIGGGITSVGLSDIDVDSISTKLPFFTTFLPSFCLTYDPAFAYGFYLAYDWTDLAFTDFAFIRSFHAVFSAGIC